MSTRSPGLVRAARAGTWLTRARVNGYSAILLAAYVPMMAKVFLEATRSSGSDFMAFWGAGKLVAAGTPALAYSLPAETAAQAASGLPMMFAYVNPPPFLFLTAPLGLMPYPLAWIFWALSGWAVWYAVARRIMPRAAIAIAAFPGAYIAASHAQNGFVTGALLVGGALALARSEMLGGALLGLLIVKPHLALLVPFWLAAGGKWRAFAAAGASATLACLISWAVFGTATWLAYPQSFEVSRVLMAQDGGPFFLRMATFYGTLRYHLGPDAALVVQAAATLAAGAISCLYWRRAPDVEGAGAMLLAATAVASPYLFNYDLPMLVLPVFWLVRQGLAKGFRPWETAALIALYVSPFATRAAALPLGANLMPIAAIGMMWLIWTRDAGAGARSAEETASPAIGTLPGSPERSTM